MKNIFNFVKSQKRHICPMPYALCPVPFAFCLLPFAFCYLIIAIYCGTAANAANAINRGTTVAARVSPTGLYSPECYDAYYGCMGQFCTMDNQSGGSCACSDESAKYLAVWENAKKIRMDAEEVKTVGVERVLAGANVDIIFTGTREYDAAGNVIQRTDTDQQNKQPQADMLALWDTSDMFASPFSMASSENIADLTGDALYGAAHDMCQGLMPAGCTTQIPLLERTYLMQIKSDCAAFKNDTDIELADAKSEMAAAELDVRDAMRANFNTANEFNRGECLVNFKECMTQPVACGANWAECVSVSANENMQITRRTQVKDYFTIDPNTMLILDTKRNMCERILDKCIAVRDMVWTDFLREAAPNIRAAQLARESQLRGSCLTTISNCIHTACAEDIAGKGVATMDACLTRPEMVQSFCKVELEPCQAMDGQIWEYVKGKLAAMRVDSCTNAVKSCLTDENRCGADYSQCVGLDTDDIVRLCPAASLVACQDPANGMVGDAIYDGLAGLVDGIFLNIDNSLLKYCQTAADNAMAKVCGDTESCDTMITENGGLALKYEICEFEVNREGTEIYPKSNGKCYPSADAIPDADKLDKALAGFIQNTLFWGEITYDMDTNLFTTWEEYMAAAEIKNTDKTYEMAREGFDLEMAQMINSVEGTIKTIEADPIVQYCKTGRRVQGMEGHDIIGGARFPNLTAQMRGIIANSTLNASRENYSAKFNDLLIQMTEDGVKIATDIDDAALGKVCNNLAEQSTLPTSKSPRGAGIGKWIAVSLIAIAGIVGSIFTFGAAGIGSAVAIAALIGATASVGAVATAGIMAAEPTGKGNVDNWNYKENVTTTWNPTTGICTKVRVTQNCEKPKKAYCKQWGEQYTHPAEEIRLK